MENLSAKFEITVNRFTEESADKFAKQLNEAASIDPNHPITIYIDSYGGYCYSLIAMMETLRSVPNPIITAVKGKAMSCGALLLAMGDRRFCGKDSSIMIHEISGGAIGNIDDIRHDAKETERLNVQIMGILAEKMEMTYEQLKAKITVDGRRDWYLQADEAKELGLIHEIGMPLVKPHVMYSIESVPEKRIVIEKESDVVAKEVKKPKVSKPKPKKAVKKTKTVPKTKKRK